MELRIRVLDYVVQLSSERVRFYDHHRSEELNDLAGSNVTIERFERDVAIAERIPCGVPYT